MALIIEDRVVETTTTTGTGALTLAGALTSFRAFSSVCATSDTVYYLIEAIDANGALTGDWETGLGTYSGANTLTRTTVKRSSNANAAVSLAAGTKRVSMAPTAAYTTRPATWDHMWNYADTASGAAAAGKGLKILPQKTIVVDGLSTQLTAQVNGASYVGYICTMTSGTTVNTILGTSATVTGSGTSRLLLLLEFATPITLTAGIQYGIIIARTDGGGTYVLPVPSTAAVLRYCSAPVQNDGYMSFTTVPITNGLASAANAATADGYLVGLRYFIP